MKIYALITWIKAFYTKGIEKVGLDEVKRISS